MLDRKNIDMLRGSINSSAIFWKEEQYIDKYNLTCAVMDRLETAIGYLNLHIHMPASEEELLIFMMFACMVVDASKELFRVWGIDYSEPDEYKYFKHAYTKDPLRLKEEEYPTDDKFFEYFRSLTFAHPYKTTRARFIPNGQRQYSPWVIINNSFNINKDRIIDAVGVRIYFSDSKESKDLYVSFSNLVDYIDSRYKRIAYIIEWINQEVVNRKEEWLRHQIPIECDDIDNLKNIITELRKRYEETYDIEELLVYMSCTCSIELNRKSIKKYRMEIHNAIPDIIKAVNESDENYFEIVHELLYARPENAHSMLGYQLEKIFSYLYDDDYGSNKLWAIKQLEAFAGEFARDWVVFDIVNMSYDEIRLLVTIACRAEAFSQKDLHIYDRIYL